MPTHILITGASSGIGAALARHYAAKGCILSLSGRDSGRLNAVADDCRAQGAEVDAVIVDVADAAAMEQWISARNAALPVDLVIANAGISGGTGAGDGTGLFGETAEQTRQIFAVNLGGVLNTVLPLLPSMRNRGAGQIAIISSLAGFRGLPGAPAYSASKMAVRGWSEALRGLLAPEGLRVSTVCPGYVRSRITATNRFPMPGLMDAERAAALIARGLEKNRSRITFPWWFALMCWFIGSLPPMWTDWLYGKLPRK